MKIGLAQLNPTVGDLAHNAKQILQVAQQAAAAGTRLLLTPELSLCGYPPRDLLLSSGFVATMADALAQLAHNLPPELTVLVGTVQANPQIHEYGGKSLFNSIALLQGGAIQQYFHKRLLPTYDVFDEDRYFEPAQQSNAFILTLDPTTAQGTDLETLSLHVGVTICEDLWNDEGFWGRRNYPVNPLDDLADQGVELIVNLSASPYSVGKQAMREAMLQHAAARYRQPILYTNQVGGNDDLIFDGSSIAFDRQGKLVARARAFATDLLLVEYDLKQRQLQLVPDDDTPAIAPIPASKEGEIWSALVLGVRDYARKCGFGKIALGLSGGIDSALVAAIAAAAVGAENVLGILMPSPYSSDHSVSDALELAENLGIATQTLPIGELMKGYDAALGDLFAGTEPGVAEENIQARIRGNLLMAVANKFGYLLLSTGNKSEMAVGYCTLYGDMNGGLAAIADVPKTRVYDLCRWLNQQANQALSDNPPHLPLPTLATNRIAIIPPNIIQKPPSAELRPDQCDQDSLPPYDVLDNILEQLVHHHRSPAEIVASGCDRATVDKVVRLVVRAEFKRRQAPPGLKITDRAFGTGWRMPIACKGLDSL